MRYWLVEATDRSGACWGFLFASDRKPSDTVVVSRMKSLGRVIEISGQTVEVARLNLSSLVSARDATRRRSGGSRYTIEGDEID